MELPTPHQPRELRRVQSVVDNIFELLDVGLPVPPTMLVRFNCLTGRPWPEEADAGVTSRKDFARWAAIPLAAPVAFLPDHQAMEMIRRIQAGDCTHAELCCWITLLVEHTGDPRFADLIFWPVRQMRPREVLIAARRRWRGEPVGGAGLPVWLLLDEETWALSHEWVGVPVPPRVCRAA